MKNRAMLRFFAGDRLSSTFGSRRRPRHRDLARCNRSRRIHCGFRRRRPTYLSLIHDEQELTYAGCSIILYVAQIRFIARRLESAQSRMRRSFAAKIQHRRSKRAGFKQVGNFSHLGRSNWTRIGAFLHTRPIVAAEVTAVAAAS